MIQDFVYDGRSLSSQGYIICGFSDDDDIDTIDTDSQRSFSNISLFNGKRQPFTSVTYNDPLAFTYQCCKNPCDDDDLQIPIADMQEIKRWLSPPTPRKLELPDDERYAGFYMEGIWNVSEVWGAGKCIGFQISFNSNRPYALKNLVTQKGSVSANGSFVITDTSDDQGFVYPTLMVTCKSAGTLTLHNSYDGRDTIVKNCAAKQIICFTPELQISSSNKRNFSDDFNWKFLRIGNTLSNRKNTITSSIAIDYVFSYSPVAKVVFQ